MMTAQEGRDFIITAIQNGVSNYIVKPFTPEKLEDAIRKSWNSAKKRLSTRHASLPKHQLIVKINGKSFPAKVLTISRTGALIKMTYCDEIKLFSRCELCLLFEKIGQLGAFTINPLPGTVVRLEAEDSFHPSTKTCEVALYFAANDLDKKIEKSLKNLLKFLNSLDPEIIKDSQLKTY